MYADVRDKRSRGFETILVPREREQLHGSTILQDPHLSPPRMAAAASNALALGLVSSPSPHFNERNDRASAGTSLEGEDTTPMAMEEDDRSNGGSGGGELDDVLVVPSHFDDDVADYTNTTKAASPFFWKKWSAIQMVAAMAVFIFALSFGISMSFGLVVGNKNHRQDQNQTSLTSSTRPTSTPTSESESESTSYLTSDKCASKAAKSTTTTSKAAKAEAEDTMRFFGKPGKASEGKAGKTKSPTVCKTPSPEGKAGKTKSPTVSPSSKPSSSSMPSTSSKPSSSSSPSESSQPSSSSRPSTSSKPSSSSSPSESSKPSSSSKPSLSTSPSESSMPSTSSKPSSSSSPSETEVPSGPQTATYDPALTVPKCSFGSSCDSGTLLNGRGNLAGGNEPNQPNTLNSCTDGNSGTYHNDESVDRIVVSRASGGDNDLTEGEVVTITATVWCWSTGTSSYTDFYYASDASNPVWNQIGLRQVCPGGGSRNKTATYTLPQGAIQAVRVNFMFGSTAVSAASCTSGVYDDVDDLVITVKPNPAMQSAAAISPSSKKDDVQGAIIDEGKDIEEDKKKKELMEMNESTEKPKLNNGNGSGGGNNGNGVGNGGSNGNKNNASGKTKRK